MRLLDGPGSHDRTHSRTLAVVGTGVVVIIAIAVPGLFVLAGKSSASQSAPILGQSYSDNGLTCNLPVGLPPFVAHLVAGVVQSQKFLNTAGGETFVFEHWDNITYRSETIGSTTTQLPPATELVFYTYGPNTACGMMGEKGATEVIYAQVPLENEAFNLSDETVNLSQYVGQPG
jgi:hypothetical protein